MTGSQGKTSTKDLLAQVLEAAGETVAPYGNFNNEVGLPLTVARIGADTRYLVAEMGARGIGHIAYLCRIAPPEIGIVLNVGTAHLGEFGSVAAIAAAKGELVEALPATGVAVLNADDRAAWAMRSRTRARIVGYSAIGPPAAEDAIWAESVRPDPTGCCAFRVCSSDRSEPEVEVQLRISGRHQVGNALAAVAAARALGLGLDQIAGALEPGAASIPVADGDAPPLQRGTGHQRRVQRQSGVDAGRVGHPGRHRPSSGRCPHLGRARRHARTRLGRGDRAPVAGPLRRRPGSASTGRPRGVRRRDRGRGRRGPSRRAGTGRRGRSPRWRIGPRRWRRCWPSWVPTTSFW